MPQEPTSLLPPGFGAKEFSRSPGARFHSFPPHRAVRTDQDAFRDQWELLYHVLSSFLGQSVNSPLMAFSLAVYHFGLLFQHLADLEGDC